MTDDRRAGDRSRSRERPTKLALLVGDAPADRGCLGRRPPRSRVVTGHNLPEGAPGGPPEVAALGMELLGALEGRQAVLHTAEEIRGGRQQLQVR
ncbi:MAG TPA: hypothetical protein VFJ69_14560 [Actinomycetota bacterium]|nr:hypothetical protein [Actinomycetota bacterium]